MQNIHNEQSINILNKARTDGTILSHIGARRKRKKGSPCIHVFVCF